MEARDVILDGVTQLNEWMLAAVEGLSEEQLNFLADGKTVNAGFHAWHIWRTHDNIANYVFQQKPPVWLAGGFFERTGLPKVEQGTGMPLEQARGMRFDPGQLAAYGRAVAASVEPYIASLPAAQLEEVQMIKPLGEMPRWKVFRQVFMTHGFMHLGEINALKGMQGMQFFL